MDRLSFCVCVVYALVWVWVTRGANCEREKTDILQLGAHLNDLLGFIAMWLRASWLPSIQRCMCMCVSVFGSLGIIGCDLWIPELSINHAEGLRASWLAGWFVLLATAAKLVPVQNFPSFFPLRALFNGWQILVQTTLLWPVDMDADLYEF